MNPNSVLIVQFSDRFLWLCLLKMIWWVTREVTIHKTRPRIEPTTLRFLLYCNKNIVGLISDLFYWIRFISEVSTYLNWLNLQKYKKHIFFKEQNLIHMAFEENVLSNPNVNLHGLDSFFVSLPPYSVSTSCTNLLLILISLAMHSV